MKKRQKTPASAINASGYREQALEKLFAHRAAACTGKTRLREQDLNLQPSGYEPEALPIAPSRDSFMPPLSYVAERASRHFHEDKGLGAAYLVLFCNQRSRMP